MKRIMQIQMVCQTSSSKIPFTVEFHLQWSCHREEGEGSEMGGGGEGSEMDPPSPCSYRVIADPSKALQWSQYHLLYQVMHHSLPLVWLIFTQRQLYWWNHLPDSSLWICVLTSCKMTVVTCNKQCFTVCILHTDMKDIKQAEGRKRYLMCNPWICMGDKKMETRLKWVINSYPGKKRSCENVFVLQCLPNNPILCCSVDLAAWCGHQTL